MVGIDNNGDTKIFYRALTPYLINQILARKDQQETIRTSFYEFPTKKEIFLTEGIRLAEWLKRADCLEGITTINYLQCIARQSELTEEQDTELMELLKKYDDNEQMKAGIHILLGNYKMAKRCLDKLDTNQRNEFYDFPIYALIK